ncbi:MAG: glycine--tRNA ligase [Isosphaeraceae bacterium]
MDMDKLVSLCKRRGFIFPSSEIYGGLNGFWDYGPLGVELKRNIKDAWWHDNVRGRDDMVGLDCSIIMNPRVWEASGHVGGFSDPMVDCKTEGCKGRFRSDHIATSACPLKPSKTPGDHSACQLTEPRAFNLMFKTHVGALEEASSVAYLRPETAQGIFANFKNVCDTGRVKLPFGIAQIGKSFRNEIAPRNFTFRSREFEQMEIEFFCRPEDAPTWYQYWRETRFRWYTDLGLKSEKLRLRDHDEAELAFYSTATADIEYEFPFGVSELEGIAHRGNYDLTQHQKFSGKDLTYFDEEKKERFLPHVIEPSAGADRGTLAFLCEAYTEDTIGGEARTVLKFHPRLAPIKAAIFPLVKRDGMPELAEKIYRDLKTQFQVFFDEKGAIGRRYRRQDEAGTPFGITVDSQTIADGTVTFRDRDSCRQWRVPSAGVVQALRDLLDGKPIPAENLPS